MVSDDGGDDDSGDDESVDEVDEVDGGVSGFFLNILVNESKKPPFIVLFFLRGIYIIIQEIII